MQDLCSVVMPVYNPKSGLEDSIESIINQTYKEIEFLIINDGSSKEFEEIINFYAHKYKNIRVLNNKEKKGIVHSLNLGFSYASGKYIARMDSDDFSLPNRIETQINHLEKNPELSILGSQALICDENMSPLHQTKLPISQEDIKFALISSNPLIHPSVIFRRSHISIFKNELYIKNNILNIEDYDLWIRALSLGLKIENHNKVLIKYRKSGDSLSHTILFKSNNIHKKNILNSMISIQKRFPINLKYSFRNFNSYNLLNKRNYIHRSQIISYFILKKSNKLIFSRSVFSLFLINNFNNSYIDFLSYLFFLPYILFYKFFLLIKKTNK